MTGGGRGMGHSRHPVKGHERGARAEWRDGLDKPAGCGYNKDRKGHCAKRSAQFSSFLTKRSRHWAEWRLLPFIRIVTVYPRIWNVTVIGIASPPFGSCG